MSRYKMTLLAGAAIAAVIAAPAAYAETMNYTAI